MTEKYERLDPTILDRPQISPHVRNLREINKVAIEAEKRLLQATRDNQPLLLVQPFDVCEENSAELFIVLLMARLNKQEPCQLLRPDMETSLSDDYRILLLHHAPGMRSAGELLAEARQRNLPVLITGDGSALERLDLDAVGAWLPPFDRQEGHERMQEIVNAALDALVGKEVRRNLQDCLSDLMKRQVRARADEALTNILEQRAEIETEDARALLKQLKEIVGEDHQLNLVQMVCAADAWGVCLPLDLLALSLDMEPDAAGTLVRKAMDQQLLFWHDRSHPAALTVSSGGVRLARQLLPYLGVWHEELFKRHQAILKAVDWEEPAERHAALQLVRNLLMAPARRLRFLGTSGSITRLRALVRSCCGQLWQDRGILASPEEALAWSGLLHDLGLPEQALAVLDRVRDQWGGDIRLRHLRARILTSWSLLAPSRRSEAEAAWKTVYSADQASPYVLHGMADFFRNNAEFAQARELLDYGLAIDPENPVLVLARIDLALDERDWPGAENMIRTIRAKELFPENIRFLHLEARLRWYTGKPGPALDLLDDIQKLDPYNLYVRSTKAEIALEQQETEQAGKLVDKGLSQDPENTVLLNTMARIRLAQNDFSMAETIYEKIIEIEGGESPHTLAGKIHLSLLEASAKADPERAEILARTWEMLRRLRERMGDCPMVLHFKGRYFELGGDDKRAMEVYESILRQQQRNHYALISLARLARKREETDLYRKSMDVLQQLQTDERLTVQERKKIVESLQELGEG